jgi:lipopolysaccharide/colanic/teichoic acid biosynthesis glycosyltransferase
MQKMKRTFDFLLALTGLIVSLPLWFLLALVIWLEDKGSIFYFQDRIGKDGKIFKNIQFRSMITNAEVNSGPLQAKEYDYRVTKIGRIIRNLAIDELPQLINIAKGEMSFVGPRARERCNVSPGLTGIAQLFKPRDLSRNEKFKYDIWYIKNHTFRLDLYLILLSFLVTFRGKWESRSDKFMHVGRKLEEKIEREI